MTGLPSLLKCSQKGQNCCSVLHNIKGEAQCMQHAANKQRTDEWCFKGQRLYFGWLSSTSTCGDENIPLELEKEIDDTKGIQE
jgi:hypothetical protein